ncbi:MAG: hypothetical protein KC912_23220, partial [Proteobacteria bacterium]|nr:hypothetical protein [Pseudomonadota bacterium]
MVAGLQVEEGHHGGYAVCNDGSSSVAMGWMSVPLDLNLRAKLDADAVADLNPNEGTWSTGSTLSGHPAREEHRANPGMEGPNAVRRARFVLHGGKLYIAAIISEDPD